MSRVLRSCRRLPRRSPTGGLLTSGLLPWGLLVGGLLALLLWMQAAPCYAQATGAATPGAAASDSAAAPIVDAVRFRGQDVFAREALMQQVRTQANRRLLGIPGFTWWRGLYRLGDALGGRIGGALKRSGEPPARLSRAVLQEDATRLQALFRQEGFRTATVEPRVEPLGGDGDRVRVVFAIAPGPPMQARRVRFEGVEALSEEQRRQLVRASLLRPEGDLPEDVPPDSLLRFQATGERYSASKLLAERQRVLTFLRNEGYAAATRDSIRALVFPRTPAGAQAPDSFDVTFRVRPGRRYRFGAVTFDVQGPEPSSPARTDTLARIGPAEEGAAESASAESAAGPEALITAQIERESQLDFSLLRRTLRAQPGAWYDESALLATKRRLEGTGVFTFTDINVRSADSVGAGAPRLAHQISLRTRRRHSIRFETFALQRSGVLSDELGTGVGVTYQNANLFGEGEAFQVRTAGSIAADFDSTTTLFSSAQAEVSTSLTYPYLVSVFSGLERRLGLFDARTRISLSLLTARRENLRFILRGRGTARARFDLRHTPTISSLIDLTDVSISNPDTLSGFGVFLDSLIGTPENPIVTDPVQRAQITEDYTEPQVNTALRYTFRSANVNPLLRAQGYSYEASLEVGNTLPYVLDRLVLSPDTVESSLPGLPALRGAAANRLIYRPYVRFVGDLRRYRRLDARNVLAGKFFVGLAHPTGPPDLVPFDRRFYSGGATSVRGWGLRELRPVPDSLGGGVPNILGGDVKLEASLELRSVVLENALNADWLTAFFVDAGNVWLGPRNPGAAAGRFRFDRFYRQIGVGAGVGLRLAFDYLILRLDAAYKVHDPLQEGSGFFPRSLRSPRLYFGIGHAF